MSKLTILPVGYRGERLKEVGGSIIHAFYPLIDDFAINNQINLTDLDKEIMYKLDSRNTLLFGKEFIYYISKYGQRPILGITSLPAIFNKDGFEQNTSELVYGVGNRNVKAAFVSTYRTEFGKIDSEEHIERLVIEAIHELGHIFELGHHYKEKKTYRNKLCPMTNAHDSKARAGKITWGDYISLRDSLFCKDCYSKLGIPEK